MPKDIGYPAAWNTMTADQKRIWKMQQRMKKRAKGEDTGVPEAPKVTRVSGPTRVK